MSKISLKLCKFFTESPFDSWNLDLGKICVHAVIHFWPKSGKVRELESQKVKESQGTLLKNQVETLWQCNGRTCTIVLGLWKIENSNFKKLAAFSQVLGSPPPHNLKIDQIDNNNNKLLVLPYLDSSSFFNQEAISKLHLTLVKVGISPSKNLFLYLLH